MNDIGQILATYPSVAAVPSVSLRPEGSAAGGGFSVLDPSSFKPLLALAADDRVFVLGLTLGVTQAMDWLIDLDRRGLVPIVTEEGHLGGIPPKSLRRRSPGTALRPEIAAAFRARIDRWDTEKALAAAIGADTDALLKLAA